MTDLQDLRGRILAALGRAPLDLLVTNVQLVDVFRGQVVETEIGICSGRVVSVLPGQDRPAGAAETLDARGLFALPGFIDAHVHIESTLLTPAHLAEVIVPKGTTSLLADPMEVANVAGPAGVEAFVSGIESLPYRLFLQVSSRVPTAPGRETTGGVLGSEDVAELLSRPYAVSLGELDPSKVLGLSDEHLLKVLSARAAGKLADGHAIGLEGAELEAYAGAGLTDDHECVTFEQLVERLAVGMAVMVREGSSERNLHDLLQGVVAHGLDTRHLMFCTDDKHPAEIRSEGHINYNVNAAIELGLPPVQAIQMASLNAAVHFRAQDQIGVLAPGRLADFLLCDSLDRIEPEMVFVGGKLAAKAGRLVAEMPAVKFPAWVSETVKVTRGTRAEEFMAPAQGDSVEVRVIRVVADQIFNHLERAELRVAQGQVVPDLEQDVVKLACVERYGINGNVAVGWVRGFGLRRGAIGCSVAHDHHNLLIVGTNDADMAACVRALADSQGGFVVAEGGEVRGLLPLPIFGLMSQDRFEDAERGLRQVRKAAAAVGCVLPTPFMTLSFVSLPSIPEAGFSDLGLIDVRTQALLPTVLR